MKNVAPLVQAPCNTGNSELGSNKLQEYLKASTENFSKSFFQIEIKSENKFLVGHVGFKFFEQTPRLAFVGYTDPPAKTPADHSSKAGNSSKGGSAKGSSGNSNKSSNGNGNASGNNVNVNSPSHNSGSCVNVNVYINKK
jgi:hypothetical protein